MKTLNPLIDLLDRNKPWIWHALITTPAFQSSLTTLNLNEQFVVEQHFGNGKSLGEIAAMIKRSPERVRQIRNKGLRRLKQVEWKAKQ